jgi:hypothetical protein
LVDAIKVDAVVAKIVAKIDAIKVDVVVAKEVVATVVAAKVDVVIDVAEAEEVVANLHKVARVSEVEVICLSRPGTHRHHRRHQGTYRKNHKYTPQNTSPFKKGQG